MNRKEIPPFPKTPHLPSSRNHDSGDVVADSVVLSSYVCVEEKVDGASVGFSSDDGNPVVRNRNNMLKKGYARKDTPAKKQFRPIWNYFYDNKNKFNAVFDKGSYVIYGEWMWAQHGIYYDSLPDWFIAYDVYDLENQFFLSPNLARSMLIKAGFECPQLFFEGQSDELDLESIPGLSRVKSKWSSDTIEGVYIKSHDGSRLLHRYKYVRDDFERGKLWSNEITKNRLSV